jgi:hypothetical protein
VKVELAITMLELAYENADRRKSGHEWISHPLRAGLFAAAIGSPADFVITALLHDIVEDTQGSERGGNAFRVPAYENGAVVCRALHAEKDKYRHLEDVFGRWVAEGIRLLTRDSLPRKILEYWWQEKDRYRKYLDRINDRGNAGAVFAKAMDGIVNLWELDLPDGELETKMKQSTVGKAAMQVGVWRKLSWLINYMLLEGIAAYSEDERLVRKLRSFTEKDVADFERGVVIVKKRELRLRLISGMPDNGTPIIAVYQRRKFLEIEIPYLDGRKPEGVLAGKEILLRFCPSATNIKQVETLLVSGMRKVAIFRFNAKKSELKRNAAVAVKEYDKAIALELMAYGINDRKAHAAAARKSAYYEPNIRREKAGTPPPGSEASLELSGLPGPGERKEFPSRVKGEEETLPVGSFVRWLAGG